MRNPWTWLAVLAPLACAKPVASPPAPPVHALPSPAPVEAEAPLADTPAEVRGPRIWLTSPEHEEFSGIGRCSFSVGYGGFPAVSPDGQEIATAAWDDPGDNLGDGDLGRLRIGRRKLDGTREDFVVYDAESGSCDEIRTRIEGRLQKLRTDLASWKPMRRIAGAAMRKVVGPGGPETQVELPLSAFAEDATLVFEDDGGEVVRFDVPAIEQWDTVDVVHGDVDLGQIVVAVRAYGLKDSDVVGLVIIDVPSSFFRALDSRQPRP